MTANHSQATSSRDTNLKDNGVKHRRITPLWPQAKSEPENFMKPLTKAIQSAHTEGEKWAEHQHRFILNY